MATDCGCHVVSDCSLHKAAGKLLEACKHMVRFVKRWGPENKDPWEDIVELARAIIKEAEA